MTSSLCDTIRKHAIKDIQQFRLSGGSQCFLLIRTPLDAQQLGSGRTYRDLLIPHPLLPGLLKKHYGLTALLLVEQADVALVLS